MLYRKDDFIMLLPKYIFSKLTDISPDFLRAHSIRLLLMDFDNTMLPYTTNEPSPELLQWMEEVQSAGIRLCIVSNSKRPRVPDFSKTYGIPCVIRAGKPGCRGIRRAMEQMGVREAALVGDQIYTDVLGANRAGIPSIIVRSIHNHTIWLKLRHLLEIPFLAMARGRKVKS